MILFGEERASDHPCRLGLEDVLLQLVKVVEILGRELHDWTESALAINKELVYIVEIMAANIHIKVTF